LDEDPDDEDDTSDEEHHEDEEHGSEEEHHGDAEHHEEHGSDAEHDVDDEHDSDDEGVSGEKHVPDNQTPSHQASLAIVGVTTSREVVLTGNDHLIAEKYETYKGGAVDYYKDTSEVAAK
jgi:hypothetical protein